jgi:hypothetical protein
MRVTGKDDLYEISGYIGGIMRGMRICAKNKSEPNSIRLKSSSPTFLVQNIIVDTPIHELSS